MTVSEAAAYLGVSRQRVMHLVKTGRIAATRFGHMHKLNRADVEKYRQSRRK